MFATMEFFKDKYKLKDEQIIIFSIIFLLIISGLFNSISENVFIITIFYWIAKMIYISNFLGRDYFQDKRDFKLSLILIIVSFIINKYVINKVNSIFLSPSENKIVVWIFVFIYLYKFISNRNVNSNESDIFSKEKLISKKNIIVSYAKLRLKFDEEIVNKEPLMRVVIYTIMVYENYKRPFIFRKIDNLLFKINNNSRKLGIMQVQSKKQIDDIDSIRLVCKKIDSIYDKKKNLKKKDDIGFLVLNSYYKSINKEIEFIYGSLKEFNNL